MAKHKDRGLVNGKKGEHSSMTVVDHNLDLTKWKVDATKLAVDTAQLGKWKVKQVGTGKTGKDIQVLLTCDTPPTTRGTLPPDGTVTITMTDGTTSSTVNVPVDYVSDTPP